MPDYENGPVLSMKTSQISSIEYKNGIIDRLGNQNPRKNKAFGISTGLVVAASDWEGSFSATLDYRIIQRRFCGAVPVHVRLLSSGTAQVITGQTA